MAKEYIPREAVLNLLEDEERYGYLDSSDINSIPAADVVDVVRCKDYRWWKQPGCAIRIVDETDEPEADDFCSFGERRNNNG